MSAEDAGAVLKWIGPPTRDQLMRRIKAASAWSIPLGLFFVGSAFLVDSRATWTLRIGPIDVLAMFMGLSMVASGLIAKWRPHRVCFLLHSVFFGTFTLTLLPRVIAGAWGWLILILFTVWLGLFHLHQFHRFATVTVGQAPNPEPG
ncbi:MAG: hypothetical protein AB1705_19220 [Verrucomicrobiota bacterium]